MRVVLSIGGSDSGGGAGIQADLKTMSALGVYGATVITAVTVQDTSGVHEVHALAPELVRAQIETAANDYTLAATKIGMLANASIVEAVASTLAQGSHGQVVLDPVCASTSGELLLDPDALELLRVELLPHVDVLTPNLPEAALILGRENLGQSDAELAEAAREILGMGCGAVLLKGGHREGDPDDVFVDADGVVILEGERIPDVSVHGTGCTMASAVASFLARGRGEREAVAGAKEFVRRGIEERVGLGRGQANLHWFWEYYGKEGLP